MNVVNANTAAGSISALTEILATVTVLSNKHFTKSNRGQLNKNFSDELNRLLNHAKKTIQNDSKVSDEFKDAHTKTMDIYLNTTNGLNGLI